MQVGRCRITVGGSTQERQSDGKRFPITERSWNQVKSSQKLLSLSGPGTVFVFELYW